MFPRSAVAAQEFDSDTKEFELFTNFYINEIKELLKVPTITYNLDDYVIVNHPPKLKHIMSFIRLLKTCGEGRNNFSENLAQVMFPLR